MCGTCPTHLMLLNFITLKKSGKEHKPWRSLFYSCLQLYITVSLLGPNSFISTLFSKTLKLCHFLSVGYNVSHLYKTRGKHEQKCACQMGAIWTDNCCKSIICLMFSEWPNSGKSRLGSPFLMAKTWLLHFGTLILCTLTDISILPRATAVAF
jgi:hypothetical protein